MHLHGLLSILQAFKGRVACIVSGGAQSGVCCAFHLCMRKGIQRNIVGQVTVWSERQLNEGQHVNLGSFLVVFCGEVQGFWRWHGQALGLISCGLFCGR